MLKAHLLRRFGSHLAKCRHRKPCDQICLHCLRDRNKLTCGPERFPRIVILVLQAIVGGEDYQQLDNALLLRHQVERFCHANPYFGVAR
jgi:hypothetical protein